MLDRIKYIHSEHLKQYNISKVHFDIMLEMLMEVLQDLSVDKLIIQRIKYIMIKFRIVFN